MRHLYLILLLSNAILALDYKPLTPKQLKAEVKKPCVIVHFWASWCDICVRELPVLLPFLDSRKEIKSVVVDLSHPIAQEKFSKTWLEKIAPNSATFNKSKLHDHDLVDIVVKKWNGGLPVTALYAKGKRKFLWEGSVALSEVSEEVKKHCKVSP